eukprot:UN06129
MFLSFLKLAKTKFMFELFNACKPLNSCFLSFVQLAKKLIQCF